MGIRQPWIAERHLGEGGKTMDSGTRLAERFPTLATFKVGDGRDMLAVLKSLRRKVWVSGLAKVLMGHETYVNSIAKKEESIELHFATVKELTRRDDEPTISGIHIAILTSGYDLCQPEDGPRLLEVYQGSDMIFLAMKAIRIFDDDPHIFCVRDREGELWLDASDSRPCGLWWGDNRFAFRARKAKTQVSVQKS